MGPDIYWHFIGLALGFLIFARSAHDFSGLGRRMTLGVNVGDPSCGP
jgi:hypothetical protein